jgi:predicted membrane protein
MQNADFFQTLSQISVAFAGFAGVVNTLGRSTLDPKARAFRIRSLIGWSLFALFFSMFPFIVSQFGISEPKIWRLCSAFLAISQTVGTAIVWYMLIPLYREGRLDSKSIAIFISFVTVLDVVLLLINSIGFFSEVNFSAGIYLIGVIWALSQACYLFIRLILFVQPSEG